MCFLCAARYSGYKILLDDNTNALVFTSLKLSSVGECGVYRTYTGPTGMYVCMDVMSERFNQHSSA